MNIAALLALGIYGEEISLSIVCRVYSLACLGLLECGGEWMGPQFLHF